MRPAPIDSRQPSGHAPLVGGGPGSFIGLGIAWAAIVLLVGTGGAVMPPVVAMLAGVGIGPDTLLANALILNIALVILGWRRQSELKAEVRDRRAAEAAARRLAETDPLTGCLNRRALANGIGPFLAAARARGEVAACVMLDLDNFKPINDAHGHAAGDAILCTIARRVADALPAGALLARLGGDEFACAFAVSPQRTGDADRIVARLIAAVTAPIAAGGITAVVTASLGLACADGDDDPAVDTVRSTDDTVRSTDDTVRSTRDTVQSLLHRADIAMYCAKAAGRNRAIWYTPAMQQAHRQRTQVEAAIRRALARGEFVPRFVRRIDAATGTLLGFEMQPHWQSPDAAAPDDGGASAAASFMPIIEDMGLIGPLFEALLTQALSEMRGWDPALTLSVPAAPAQVRDPWFAQNLLRLLIEAGVAPARIDIAISEACLAEDPGGAIASLRDMGVGICLDGFGTGWGLGGGRNAPPVDRIAIDPRFVAPPGGGDGADGCQAAMARAIAAFSQGLGVPITTTGVTGVDVRACLRVATTAEPVAEAAAGLDDSTPRAAADVRAALALAGRLITLRPAVPAPMPTSPAATRAIAS